jgi:hypothetical protein
MMNANTLTHRAFLRCSLHQQPNQPCSRHVQRLPQPHTVAGHLHRHIRQWVHGLPDRSMHRRQHVDNKQPVPTK